MNIISLNAILIEFTELWEKNIIGKVIHITRYILEDLKIPQKFHYY